MAATPEDKKTAEYVAQKFRAAGLETEIVPYRVLMNRTVMVYCLLLPIGLSTTIGWLTPIIATFVAYTFLALDVIAEQIEEPFGTEPNDLALASMCHALEVSVCELVGETPVSCAPENGVTVTA